MKIQLKPKKPAKNLWIEHLWFAWHPVRTSDNKLVWLEDVIRYRISTGNPDWPYAYRYKPYNKHWPY